MTQSWSGGFAADVTVRNTGTRPTTGWTVAWTYASDDLIAGGRRRTGLPRAAAG